MIDLSEDRRNCDSCVAGRGFCNFSRNFCKNCIEYMPDENHDEFGWEIEFQSEEEINDALCDMDVMGNIDCVDPVPSESCLEDCSRYTCYYAWFPSNGL